MYWNPCCTVFSPNSTKCVEKSYWSYIRTVHYSCSIEHEISQTNYRKHVSSLTCLTVKHPSKPHSRPSQSGTWGGTRGRPALHGRLRTQGRLGLLHLVDRSQSGVRVERVPLSWRWTAGRTCPVWRDTRWADACMRSTSGLCVADILFRRRSRTRTGCSCWNSPRNKCLKIEHDVRLI